MRDRPSLGKAPALTPARTLARRPAAAEGIEECLNLMIERAVKLNEVVDKEALMEDIENALADFLE